MIKIYELTKVSYMNVKAILGDRVFNAQEYMYNVWNVVLNDSVILKYNNGNLTLDLGGKKAIIENRNFYRVQIF